jgi:hypothetical protein
MESPKKLGRNTKKIDYDEDLGSLRVEGFISHPQRSRNFKSAKRVSITRPLITPPIV